MHIEVGRSKRSDGFTDYYRQEELTVDHLLRKALHLLQLRATL